MPYRSSPNAHRRRPRGPPMSRSVAAEIDILTASHAWSATPENYSSLRSVMLGRDGTGTVLYGYGQTIYAKIDCRFEVPEAGPNPVRVPRHAPVAAPPAVRAHRGESGQGDWLHAERGGEGLPGGRDRLHLGGSRGRWRVRRACPTRTGSRSPTRCRRSSTATVRRSAIGSRPSREPAECPARVRIGRDGRPGRRDPTDEESDPFGLRPAEPNPIACSTPLGGRARRRCFGASPVTTGGTSRPDRRP